MKNTGRCPKCSFAKLYVVEEVRQPDHDSHNNTVPMHVHSAEVPPKVVGLADADEWRTSVGRYEAWICASCGYTEWYAKDFVAALEKLVRFRLTSAFNSFYSKVGVRIVETPGAGPYR